MSERRRSGRGRPQEPVRSAASQGAPLSSRLKASAAAREARVAEAILRTWRTQPPAEGPALVVDDRTDRVRQACQGQAWHRLAHGPFEASALPTPRPGGYACAAVRVHRDRQARDFALHQVAAALRPGGELWLYGGNDEGIRSPGDAATTLFADLQTVAAHSHCRIWRGTLAADAQPKAGLEPWWQPVPSLPDWHTLPGLFARGGLDGASQLLLQTVLGPEGKPPFVLAADAPLRLLDFGCGTGVLSAHLSALVQRRLALHALDADALAVRATERNVPGVRAFLGDGLVAVAGQKYHRIVSNPPMHVGKNEDFQVLKALLAQAGAHLLSGGDLWIVVQRQVAVHPLIEAHFEHVRCVAESTQSRVWQAWGPRA